jgi:hypothetical protein
MVLKKCFGYPYLDTMYSIIIAQYWLKAGQYTFTNTSLYFDTLWMGPPVWRSAKCIATDIDPIPVPAATGRPMRRLLVLI